MSFFKNKRKRKNYEGKTKPWKIKDIVWNPNGNLEVALIKRRIDKYGVAEPIIQKLGEDRILVQLPGFTDIDAAKSLVEQTGFLEFREVELNDGSVICGEIVSVKGGIYTLKSSTLGTVKIEESKIRFIRFEPSFKTKGKQRDSEQTPTEAQVQVLQQLIMGDKEIISMILSLLNDPEVQKILEDTKKPLIALD